MAKEVLLRCYQEGFRVSLGVINQGDSDGELGKKLGVELVEEEPFCDISEKTLDQAHQLATSAHAVILTSIPFGRGNLKNLIIARNKLASGQPVYLYNTYKNDVSYDYVGGEGKRLLEQLREMGLKEYRSIDELLESVKNLEGDRYETKT